MATYLIAFVLTVLIETGVALALGYRKRSLLLAILLVNVCTHPLLNALMLANAHFALIPDFPFLVVLEIGVVFAEWLLLRDTFRNDPRPLLRLSFWMNFTSFATGVLIYWV